MQKAETIRRVAPSAPCPRCGQLGKRHCKSVRTVHDLVGTLKVEYSKHYCTRCAKFFSVRMHDIALPSHHYTRRVERRIREMATSGVGSTEIADRLAKDYGLEIAVSSVHDIISMEETG